MQVNCLLQNTPMERDCMVPTQAIVITDLFCSHNVVVDYYCKQLHYRTVRVLLRSACQKGGYGITDELRQLLLTRRG